MEKLHQQPRSLVAETPEICWAGPFLRYLGGTEPGNPGSWSGSVLLLTRCQDEAGGPSGAAVAAERPPALELLQGSAENHLEGAPAGDADDPVLLLDCCEGWCFWRFALKLQLHAAQRLIQYTIQLPDGTATPTFTFWLPGRGHPMHFGYYSCNGFSQSVEASALERSDPTYLWRDLLQLHAAFPLHCLVAGGDQLYNDGVWQMPSFQTWGRLPTHSSKIVAAWESAMQAEATSYFLTNYIDTFTAQDVGEAMASIPQIMCWDDHDIFDGAGSYADDMQNCPVLQGVFAVARRFYLLFQHHATDAFLADGGDAGFLGPPDGRAFHFVRWMGPQVVLLGMDMRSQRSAERIMPPEAYALFRRTVAELPSGASHLVVLSGVPLIFPTVPLAERLLRCCGVLTRFMPIMRRLATRSGVFDRFDQFEVLDDLTDGWVSAQHAGERLEFIRMLQEFATSGGLRVSILSGDAPVGGVGRLYSRNKIKPICDDPLFMPQIISSAIVNAPPPHPITRALVRTNFASNVDGRTRQKLVHAFWPMHPRSDKLLSARNWCDVSMVLPPYAPPCVPQDANYGGLRFVLRAEDAKHRRGYAEETYTIIAPRPPPPPPKDRTAGGGCNISSVP